MSELSKSVRVDYVTYFTPTTGYIEWNMWIEQQWGLVQFSGLLPGTGTITISVDTNQQELSDRLIV